MKRFMLLTTFAVILITDITILGGCQNKRITISECVYEKKLKLNIPYGGYQTNIEITALEINESRQCLIQIRNISTGETKSGWFNEGDHLFFPPEEVSISTPLLHRILEKSVIVYFWYPSVQRHIWN